MRQEGMIEQMIYQAIVNHLVLFTKLAIRAILHGLNNAD